MPIRSVFSCKALKIIPAFSRINERALSASVNAHKCKYLYEKLSAWKQEDIEGFIVVAVEVFHLPVTATTI